MSLTQVWKSQQIFTVCSVPGLEDLECTSHLTAHTIREGPVNPLLQVSTVPSKRLARYRLNLLKKRRNINTDVVWANCTENDLTPRSLSWVWFFSLFLQIHQISNCMKHFSLNSVCFPTKTNNPQQQQRCLFTVFSIRNTTDFPNQTLNFVNFTSYYVSQICFWSLSILLLIVLV